MMFFYKKEKAPLRLAFLLSVAFFLPWLSWMDAGISGMDMPTGVFFEQAEQKFELANPFPEYAFLNHVFWFIPLGALSFVVLKLLNKKAEVFAYLSAALTLSLVTIYLLFTQTVIDQVGLIKQLIPAISYGAYMAATAAVILIVFIRISTIKKVFAIVGVPLITWSAFLFVSGKVLKDHDSTESIKPSYVVSSQSMLKEFEENATAANEKYKEKIVEVAGAVSEIEPIGDTTVNVKFVGETGSYIIFSFDPPYAEEARAFKEGQPVSLKGSCSGGEYIDILEAYSITFKRAIINKK